MPQDRAIPGRFERGKSHPTESRDDSSILLFSAGNPDATFLAAGLFHRDCPWINRLLLQGVDGLQPSPAAITALAEVGHAFSDRRSGNPARSLSGPIDVGITLCVPT